MSVLTRLASVVPMGLPRKFTSRLSFEAFEREVFFIAMLGSSAYFYTALASYNPFDPSWNSVSYPSATATNFAGQVGAEVASYAIHFLGLASFLLPLPLLVGALLLTMRRLAPFSTYRLLGWLFVILGASTVLAAHHPLIDIGGVETPSGGTIGDELARLLRYYLGGIGSTICIATLLIGAIIMISRRVVLEPMVRGVASTASSRKPDLQRFLQIFQRSPAQPTNALVEASSPIGQTSQHLTMPPFLSRSEAGLALEANEPLFDTESIFSLADSSSTEINPLEEGEFSSLNEGRREQTYAPPPTSIFQVNQAKNQTANQRELEATAELLLSTLADFGVAGQIVGFQPGPVVTVFEFQPENGVKQSKVMSLIDDIALALRVDSIFINPVRGKRALGIQVPNKNRETVYFGDVVGHHEFTGPESPLTFGMGKSINGQVICADLATMPHLLMAGATGSGKSVAINALLCSTIMKAAPSDVRMILVDPKMLELSVYEGIPHLLMPVITESKRASLALQWAVVEMERRYKLMQLAAVRNIAGFNDFWAKADASKRQSLREAIPDGMVSHLPYILLVIDELADLMMTAPKDVESSIQRLAQKARASGIHMVLATQRPSVDIITGVIKANLPCRVAFQVVSKHDSRTILDQPGADKLLGKGDLLLQKPGLGRLERIQGAFISDQEVLNLVAAARSGYEANYDSSIIDWIDDEYSKLDSDGEPSLIEDLTSDVKWDEAISIAQAHGVVSASFLQRHLKIGYNRAARIVETMEKQNLVGRADGSKPRQWLGGGV
jgi:DNA segregation ATPase FtsK/SpoIIIE, S-DNA-T family